MFLGVRYKTMKAIRTDQYTHVYEDCPLSVDMHPADDLVEITIGEHRFGDVTLRLVIDHPNTFLRLAEALHDAHNRLINHLRAKASHDSTASQWGSTPTW